MAEGERRVRGIGFGNIFAGKSEITLRTTHNRGDDREQQESRRSIIVEKQEKPVHSERARCTYEYKPDFEDELSMAVGDIVIILDKNLDDDGWWKGQLASTGRIGVFPNNFVELIAESDESRNNAAAAAAVTTTVAVASEASVPPRSADSTPVKLSSELKAPDSAPAMLSAKPLGRAAAAPPVGTKPKPAVKPAENPTLTQSNSTHTVSSSVDSSAVIKSSSTSHVEGHSRQNSLDYAGVNVQGGIRERLERINLNPNAPNASAASPMASISASGPASAPVTASVALPVAPSRVAARKVDEKPVTVSAKAVAEPQKLDDKSRKGNLSAGKKKGLSSGESVAEADLSQETAENSALPDETTTLHSLTKSRPKIPRLFRKLSKSSGGRSQSVDPADYAVQAAPAANLAEKERPAEIAKPPSDGNVKHSAPPVQETVSSSTTYNPPSAKLETVREVTPPSLHKDTGQTAAVGQTQKDTVMISASLSARAAPVSATVQVRPAGSPGDEMKRFEESLNELRREMATLRDENVRLDRRVSVLERELDEERRARHTLAIELESVKTHR